MVCAAWLMALSAVLLPRADVRRKQ